MVSGEQFSGCDGWDGDDDEGSWEDIVKSIPVWENIYIMPMSCVTDQQDNIAAKVAQRCIDNGYIYCHRVHLDVFDNSVGT